MENKSEVKDKFEKAKGTAKKAIDQAASALELESKKLKGQIQEGYGTAKQKVGGAIENLGQWIKN